MKISLLISLNPVFQFLQRKGYLAWILLAVFFAQYGCVPVKKITYLQYQDDQKTDNPIDTVVRKHDLKKAPYKLQPEDIISVRVASVTESKYNFILQYESDLGSIKKLNRFNTGGEGNRSRYQGNLQSLGGGDQGGGASALMLDNFNSGFSLDRNGELELPQIGKLKLAGLTVSQAEDTIKAALEGYYETPMVRVQMLSFTFTILGEVNNEGAYLSYDPEINIFDAITMAGNLTEFADRSNLKIIRQTDTGEAEIIYIDALDEKMLAADRYYLQKNDMIVVPALNVRTTTKYTLNNLNRTLGIIGTALSLTALILTLNNRR